MNQYFRPLIYNPDQLTNWEAGVKTDLFDRMVQFNLSAYYMIWNNPPIGVFNPAGGYGNTTFQTNGPSYHIKGAELQIVARPTAGLVVNAGATYNDSKQSSAPLLTVDNPASVNVGKQLTSYYKGGVQIPVLSPFGAIGAVTPFSPHWQADFRARYDWKSSEELSWFVGGGVSYISGMWNLPSTYPSGAGVSVPGTTTLRYYMPGFAQFDATLGFKHDNWTVSAFGENLGNTHASTFTSSAQFIKSEVPVRPRTYGVKINTSF